MTEFVVELWYDDDWHDVTADTRQAAADSGGGWTLIRGGISRLTVAEPDPSELTLVFNNGPSLVAPGVVGRYSLRNPLSDLYGKIRRGTPIRISVPDLTADVRVHARVAKWPTRWSTSRKDLWVPATAYGPLWWQQQGARPARSSLYRAYTQSIAGVTGYWPLEDPPGSTEAHTPTPGAHPARPVGTSRFTGPDGQPVAPAGLPDWGSGAPIPGSLRTIDLAQGGGLGARCASAAGTGWQIEWVMVQPRDEAGAPVVLWWETSDAYTDHSAETSILYGAAVAIDGVTIFYGSLSAYFGDGISVFDAADGQPHAYAVRADQDGGNIRVRVYIDNTLTATLTSTFDTSAGTVGQITRWQINPTDVPAGELWMPTLGHIAVSNGTTPAFDGGPATSAMRGWPGQRAGDRWAVTAAEDGFPVGASGDPADTEPMGPQPAGTLMEILRDCVQTDGGMLVERRGGYAIDMLQRISLYNRGALSLPFTVLAPPLEAADDLRDVRNRVIAKRTAGGELTVDLTAGPLSVAADPDGIGVIPTELPVNVDRVEQLTNIAWWELSAGTVDVPRFAAVTVNLDAPDVAALVDDVTQLDIGSVIEVTGLDAVGLPPDPVRLMVLGYTETCDYAEPWTITFVVTPADVWTVGVCDETTRAATAGSVTTADFEAGTDTALSVERSAGVRQLWTVDPTFFPMDLVAAGVRLTATACSGSGDPQTITVDQAPVNGVAKTIPAGSPVQLAEPWRPAR